QYVTIDLYYISIMFIFFFSSRRRHTRSKRDWSSDVCSSDLDLRRIPGGEIRADRQVGQRDAGRGGVRADAVHVRGVRGDVRDRRVGVVAEHGELEMLPFALRDPVDDLRKGHLPGGELRLEAVRAEAVGDVGGYGGILVGWCTV